MIQQFATMKRNYISPKRRLKKDPNLVPITNYFKTPPKNATKVSTISTPTPRFSPSQNMRQLSLDELSQRRNIRRHEAPKSTRRKLELVPVVKKLPDLVVKIMLENGVNTSNTIQCKDKDEATYNKSGSHDELPECLSDTLTPPSIKSEVAPFVNEELNIERAHTIQTIPRKGEDVIKRRGSDNDVELPECLSQESDYSSPVAVRKHFSPRKYKFDINDILEERETQKESNEQLKQMEEELRAGVITSDRDANVLEENGLCEKNLMLRVKNDIKTEPPGIDLFDLSKCFQLYSTPPPLKHPDHIRKEQFDQMFEDLKTRHSIFQVLSWARLKGFPRILRERHWILSYIFHVMSTDIDPITIHKCYETLYSVYMITKEATTFSWKPKLIDFVAVLVNCGADLRMLLPTNGTVICNFDVLKEKYSNEPHTKICSNKFSFLNLTLVFQTMTLYVQVPNAYRDEERVFLLFATASVSLAKQITHDYLLQHIRCSIEAIIASFSEEFWCRELNQVVASLLSISSHHHNIVYIAQLMPNNSRGHHILKLFCYHALSNLLEIEVKENNFSVQINHILFFCNKSILTGVKDLYKLHSVLELIELCLAPDLGNGTMTQETLEKLKFFLRDTNGKLVDRFYDSDVTIVKNMITQMMGRLSLMKDTLPSNQKTLFNCTSLASPVAAIKELKNES